MWLSAPALFEPRQHGREIAPCAISGAVGTFANVDPRVEAYVAEQLGLVPEPVSTQVIPRDRHAMYFATLAVIAMLTGVNTWYRAGGRLSLDEVQQIYWDMVRRAVGA